MSALHCPIAKNHWLQEAQRDGISPENEGEGVGKQVQDAGPWEPAVKKIVAMQQLGDDWDGFHAKAPSRELLESAVGLAYLLYGKGVPPPSRVAPGLTGTVIFEWQDADGTYTDIEIDRPLHAEVMMIEPGQPAKHWTLPTE